MDVNNYKEKLKEKKDVIKNEADTKISEVKNFVYDHSVVIGAVIVILCLCWLLYTINTGNKPSSDGVDDAVRDTKQQVSDIKQELRTNTVTADRVAETNTAVQGYNQSIQQSQRQTESNIIQAGEALQSASTRAESINTRNREAEQRLGEMQTLLGELKEQQSELDRIISETK